MKRAGGHTYRVAVYWCLMLLLLSTPGWAQLSITSIQASGPEQQPMNVSGITSTAGIPFLVLYINLNGPVPVGTATTVTWSDAATPFTYTDFEPGINGNQIQATIPSDAFAAAVASTHPIVITVTIGDLSFAPSAPTIITGSFNVFPVPGPVGPTLPPATLGAPYSTQLIAGGTPPFAPIATSGSVPGLQYSQQIDAISGVPTAVGAFPISVQVADAWGVLGLASYTLQVIPAATLSSITPNAMPAGSGIIQMTVNGANFSNLTGGPQVQWTFGSTTTALSTTFISSTQLQAIVPTALMSTAGSASVVVRQPGGFATSALPFLLNAPSLLSLNPSSALAGSGAFTLTLNGANFATRTGASDVSVGPFQPLVNFGSSTLQGTYVTSGQVTVSVPANLIATAGTIPVSVTNPGGSTTGSLNFIVSNLAVATTSLPAGTANVNYLFRLTATGGTAPYTWAVTGLPTGLTVNQQTGDISGTTATTGTFPLVATVTDAVQTHASAPLTLVINPPVLTITTTSLPSGVVGTQYLFRVAAAGGVPGYTWSATGLPPNLTMNSQTGDISGTPQTAGSFPVSIRVTDSQQAQANANLTLVVTSGLTITTTALPGGTVGSPYLFRLVAAGGAGAYLWSATGLPANLTINSQTGDISGTPQATGSYPVSVRVTDSQQSQANANFTLVISSATLTITSPVLSAGVAGNAYFFHMDATGGLSPYRWSAASIAPGLTINSLTGDITGAPTAAGTFTTTIQVTDARQGFTSRTYSLLVYPQGPAISTPSSLPNGTVGVSYSAGLDVSPAGTYTYALGSGSLPDGLTLSPAGGVSGIPTRAGTFGFSVTATETSGAVLIKGFSIVILPSPLILPDPTTTVMAGNPVRIVLGAGGGVMPYRITLNCSLPDGLSFSGNQITGTPTTPGTTDCSYSVTDATGSSATKSFTITVTPAPLTFLNGTLPSGQVGVAYNAQVAAVGGAPPVTYSGSGLPGGLSMSSTGAITGTPTAPGTFTLTATATDARRLSASASFGIVINPEGLSIVTASLPDGVVGTPYRAAVVARGGVIPYTWSITGLPSGLSADSVAAITGTPDRAGTFSVVATVKDASGLTTSSTFSVNITAPPLSIATTSLPGGTVGAAYTATVVANGGVAPLSWTAAGLPAGLTISRDGLISGTPTAPGAAEVTLTVRDSAGTSSSKTLTLSVVLPPAPPLTFNGIGATANPAQQPRLSLTLGSAYPVDITVVLTLTFVPDSGADDPAIQFSTGGRTARIVIPAGGTAGATDVGVQTGTVAGVITVSAQMLAAGVDITPANTPRLNVRIAPGAPAITQVTGARTSTGFTLTITGYATNREVTQGVFQLNAAAGTSLQTTSVTVQLDSLFTAYYASTAAAGFGGQFTFTQPFTVTGNVQGVASVTVTLTNRVGSSQTTTVTLN